MEGMTREEFLETLEFGWEIEFEIDGKSYWYQRSGIGNSFRVMMFSMTEDLFDAIVEDMPSTVERMLSQCIIENKTLSEVLDKAVVISCS